MEPRNTRNTRGCSESFLYGDLTEMVVQAAFAVHASLGSGFLEKVYENALAHEFDIRGISYQRQHPILIHYKGVIAGEYIADFLVDNKVLIELKAVSELNQIHSAQIMNYLKATNKRVGLLMNFGSTKVGIKRISL